MTEATIIQLKDWAVTYNDPVWFREDPIAFPTLFAERYRRGEACLQDVEAAGVFAAHFAWGRRAMIVRDCSRLFDEMDWKPYDYVMRGCYRCSPESIHRTVKWQDVAAICGNLRTIFEEEGSLEKLTPDEVRTRVYGQKSDLKAPNKKINMMRRWFVRNDGKVDLGIWKDSDPDSLLIPLDVHVHDVATILGLTSRKQKDIATVEEITGAFRKIFPGDPCKGDFALFGYGVTHPKEKPVD
ncbi:MAG: DUF2400 domain-containing protein [Bacteroidales bacterium]|nr:DUF2400 domain-containing protein [Bacteroidales bacterium]